MSVGGAKRWVFPTWSDRRFTLPASSQRSPQASQSFGVISSPATFGTPPSARTATSMPIASI
jgi:hypothetical protein